VAVVFKAPNRVQELAPPHRKGTVRHVAGTGSNATVTVNLDGRAPTSFRPAQLKLI